jgi:hypothetical protein
MNNKNQELEAITAAPGEKILPVYPPLPTDMAPGEYVMYHLRIDAPSLFKTSWLTTLVARAGDDKWTRPNGKDIVEGTVAILPVMGYLNHEKVGAKMKLTVRPPKHPACDDTVAVSRGRVFALRCSTGDIYTVMVSYTKGRHSLTSLDSGGFLTRVTPDGDETMGSWLARDEYDFEILKVWASVAKWAADGALFMC